MDAERAGGRLACLALAGLVAGCAAPAADPVANATVAVLHASAACAGGQDRQLEWLADADAFAALWRRVVAALPQVPAPSLDFPRTSVLYLADQQRPTAGYGMHVQSWSADPGSADATLRLRLDAPSGGLGAAVLTRPCLILALPPGPYRGLTVVDQEGRVWGRLRPP